MTKTGYILFLLLVVLSLAFLLLLMRGLRNDVEKVPPKEKSRQYKQEFIYD